MRDYFKPKSHRVPEGVDGGGYVGRKSRALPQEPCTPAGELGRLRERHDGHAGVSRGHKAAKCSAVVGRTDRPETAPDPRGRW
jgi:hypothetical protein